MADLIAELLILFESFKFWKKKKKRRQLEKNKNLPKKKMVHPTIWYLLIGIILIFCIKILFYSTQEKSLTKNKIQEVEKILEKQKEHIGKYPLKLKDIVRNNPLRKNIIVDAWGNEFYYKQLNNGSHYELKSKGRDGILDTDDDINSKK